MEREKMTTTCVRIKPETLNSIISIAESKKRSVSQMMRVIIEDYVEKVSL